MCSFLFSCNQEKGTVVKQEEMKCLCPPIIALQPCNNFSESEAKGLIPKLQSFIKDYSSIELDFEVLPSIKLSKDFQNAAKTKYKARKVIESLSKNASDHYIIIALTHDDIATKLHGQEDWGILGLSLHCYYTCIASDRRLNNPKRDFWKVIVHEFIHTYHGYSHCPKDMENCIMKDAKGKADFKNKNSLCNFCKSQLNI